jgi:sugar phosphate isomerase/epimerase
VPSPDATRSHSRDPDHRRRDTISKRFTLFTGQWADLTLEEVAELAAGWGYDGLEIAVSGEHLDAWRWDDDDYVEGRLEILRRHGLGCWAISNHLKGQAVCDDPIDDRHRSIVGPRVWGDGDPEGVRRRAAEEMQHSARLAQRMGVDVVVGFTGSSIWQYVAMFPPVPAERIEAGYQDFADRWHPILDVFDECGVRFAHEVHPSEIAYDHWSTVRTVEAIGHREAFGINWDPSHMLWQGLDPVAFISDFADRIYHVDCKDTRVRMGGGAATASSRRTCRGAISVAAGTSSPPGAGTCRGRTRSARSLASATAGRSRWSGRTPGWTGSAGHPRRSSSSSGSTSTCPPPPSTRSSTKADRRRSRRD